MAPQNEKRSKVKANDARQPTEIADRARARRRQKGYGAVDFIESPKRMMVTPRVAQKKIGEITQSEAYAISQRKRRLIEQWLSSGPGSSVSSGRDAARHKKVDHLFVPTSGPHNSCACETWQKSSVGPVEARRKPPPSLEAEKAMEVQRRNQTTIVFSAQGDAGALGVAEACQGTAAIAGLINRLRSTFEAPSRA